MQYWDAAYKKMSKMFKFPTHLKFNCKNPISKRQSVITLNYFNN